MPGSAKAAVHPQRVGGVDARLARSWTAARRVDVAPGVVVMVLRARVDALHGPEGLRGEQHVGGRQHPQHQVDAGLVVHAGVEVHVAQHGLLQRRQAHVLRQAAVAAPVERDGAAAVRNDELQCREVLEDVRRHELHERRRVAVDVVRGHRVEVRVAGAAHVDHGGHVQLHQLLEQRVPPAPVGQRRSVQRPPVGSGLTLAATKPNSWTQRSSSSNTRAPGATPAPAAAGTRRRNARERAGTPGGSARC